MSMKWFVTIFLAATQLCACVEIRDNKKTEEAPPMVEVQRYGDMLVDQPMYIYDGRILSAADLGVAQKETAKSASKDFEFRFDRLTITDRGTLYTLGNNVRLHVADLQAAGVITTFPEDQTAAQNKEGRSGGHILVDIEKGEGSLSIILRGERGGQGLKGDKPDASMMGINGAPGKNGDAFGSNGICNGTATGGGPGGKGKKGYPGKNGKNGGDSGTLELNIKNVEGFTYSIQRKPGRGGERGEGGQGGEGGENGTHGSASLSCGGFVFGPINGNNRGPEGDPGDKGQLGSDGISQTVCINKNNAMTCY